MCFNGYFIALQNYPGHGYPGFNARAQKAEVLVDITGESIQTFDIILVIAYRGQRNLIRYAGKRDMETVVGGKGNQVSFKFIVFNILPNLAFKNVGIDLVSFT